MTDLPPPPVPLDLDLRDFRWMKLDLIALFNSDFNATPDDTAWRAGVTLWGKAWHQVPAGSLPDDDATLCNLAGLGRDLKTWKRIRPQALRGFALHSDGRLYHSYLCEMAVGADEEKRRYAERRAKDRERKKAGNSAPSSAGIPQETPKPSTETRRENLIEGEGEGENKERASLRDGADAPPEKPIAEILFGSCLRYLMANGKPQKEARALIGMWRKDYGDGEVAAAIAEAQKDAASEPIGLVTAILQQRRKNAGARANAAAAPRYSNASLVSRLLEDIDHDHDRVHAGRNGAALHRTEGTGERDPGPLLPEGHLRLAGPDEAESD